MNKSMISRREINDIRRNIESWSRSLSEKKLRNTGVDKPTKCECGREQSQVLIQPIGINVVTHQNESLNSTARDCHYSLKEWSLNIVRNALIVEGIINKSTKRWHSGRIVKVCPPDVLHSISGSVYHLIGQPNRALLRTNFNMNEEVINKFLDGLPLHWSSLLQGTENISGLHASNISDPTDVSLVSNCKRMPITRSKDLIELRDTPIARSTPVTRSKNISITRDTPTTKLKAKPVKRSPASSQSRDKQPKVTPSRAITRSMDVIVTPKDALITRDTPTKRVNSASTTKLNKPVKRSKGMKSESCKVTPTDVSQPHNIFSSVVSTFKRSSSGRMIKPVLPKYTSYTYSTTGELLEVPSILMDLQAANSNESNSCNDTDISIKRVLRKRTKSKANITTLKQNSSSSSGEQSVAKIARTSRNSMNYKVSIPLERINLQKNMKDKGQANKENLSTSSALSKQDDVDNSMSLISSKSISSLSDLTDDSVSWNRLTEKNRKDKNLSSIYETPKPHWPGVADINPFKMFSSDSESDDDIIGEQCMKVLSYFDD